jgi:hypothetical protein
MTSALIIKVFFLLFLAVVVYPATALPIWSRYTTFYKAGIILLT